MVVFVNIKRIVRKYNLFCKGIRKLKGKNTAS